jgi:hypothetical protein
MKRFLFLFSSIFFLNPIFSQSVKKDSIIDLQVKNAIDIYNHYNAENAPVYNGQEYLYYTFKMEGDPFFGLKDFTYGWVSYNGRKYDSLGLIYDLVRNQVVVLSPDHRTPIVMNNEFIDSFSIFGHTFIALQEDHKQNLYNTGFYDLLYDGQNVQFLERRLKLLNPRIQGNTLTTSFAGKNHFYIHKNGLYYLVSNKKDVFRVFADQIHEMKRMMRQNHLKLKRRNFENATAKVTAFYDQLTH